MIRRFLKVIAVTTSVIFIPYLIGLCVYHFYPEETVNLFLAWLAGLIVLANAAIFFFILIEVYDYIRYGN